MSTPASSAATCRRLRTTPMSKILCETDAGELPALVGVEEIAIGGTQMPARGGAAAAAQDELPAHELAIIFADRARRGAEAGIGAIGAAGPFPHAAEQLLQARSEEHTSELQSLMRISSAVFCCKKKKSKNTH